MGTQLVEKYQELNTFLSIGVEYQLLTPEQEDAIYELITDTWFEMTVKEQDEVDGIE